MEFFEYKGHVYSVFAKDYKVVIYKGYQQVGVLEYATQTGGSRQIKPLQLLFERELQTLVLLAQTGEGTIRTYTIDVINQVMIERQVLPLPSGVQSTKRTARYFALELENSVNFLRAGDITKSVVLPNSKNI